MLILLPNIYSQDHKEAASLFSEEVKKSVESLDALIVESPKSAFPFLSIFFSADKARTFPLYIYNEHTKDLSLILNELNKGKKLGLISDAGFPCIADPGSMLVSLARKNKVSVSVVGILSPIIKALLLSGFSGQNFTFHGYLSRKKTELVKELKKIEKESLFYTQLFIEAPYRSPMIFSSLVECLHPSTFLCVAQNIDSLNEVVQTRKISAWKEYKLEKGPAVFLLSRQKQ